jgi:predicted ATP-grasp superfamily ATP-dependent carboligase
MTFFCQYRRDTSQTYSHDFYAPIILHIPKDVGISHNEMVEMSQHLSSWPDNIEAGTVALLRGQDFAL